MTRGTWGPEGDKSGVLGERCIVRRFDELGLGDELGLNHLMDSKM